MYEYGTVDLRAPIFLLNEAHPELRERSEFRSVPRIYRFTLLLKSRDKANSRQRRKLAPSLVATMLGSCTAKVTWALGEESFYAIIPAVRPRVREAERKR